MKVLRVSVFGQCYIVVRVAGHQPAHANKIAVHVITEHSNGPKGPNKGMLEIAPLCFLWPRFAGLRVVKVPEMNLNLAVVRLVLNFEAKAILTPLRSRELSGRRSERWSFLYRHGLSLPAGFFRPDPDVAL
jgi:hypothetical protein